jgi:hypothetical protein
VSTDIGKGINSATCLPQADLDGSAKAGWPVVLQRNSIDTSDPFATIGSNDRSGAFSHNRVKRRLSGCFRYRGATATRQVVGESKQV